MSLIKYFKLILFLLLIFTSTLLYSAEQGKSSSGVETQLLRKKLSETIHYPMLVGGLNAGVGFSRPMRNTIDLSEISTTLSLQISGKFFLFLNKNLGLGFDFGGHNFRISEEKDADFFRLNIIYVYLSLTPFIRYKRFIFYAGFFFGTIAFADVESLAGVDNNVKTFKTPDYGLSLGAGYQIGDYKSFSLLIFFELKSQLNTLKKDGSGGQIFAVFANVSLLFNLAK